MYYSLLYIPIARNRPRTVPPGLTRPCMLTARCMSLSSTPLSLPPPLSLSLSLSLPLSLTSHDVRRLFCRAGPPRSVAPAPTLDFA